MAKTSVIMRDIKRVAKALRAKVKRDTLRTAFKKGDDEAGIKLQKRSRNESMTRVTRRCRQCGRPKGVYRKFGLCRIHLREAMMRGDIPGLKKASW